MGTDPSTEEVAVNNDDLFGESPAGTNTATEVATEPEIETGEKIPSGEEVTEEAEVEQTEDVTEEATEEASDDLEVVLPKEQAKQYSKALMEHYAKRFGWKPEDLDSNRSYQYAVKKAIDTDIYTKSLQERLSSLETRTTEVPKKEETKTADAVPANLVEHFKTVLEETKKFNDDKVIEHLADAFMKEGDVENGGGGHVAQMRVLTAGMHNYLETVGPQMVKGWLEGLAPGLLADHGTYREQQKLFTDYAEFRKTNPAVPENPYDLQTLALEKEPLLAKLSADVTAKERFEAYARAASGQKIDPAVTEKVAEKTVQKKLEVKKTADAAKGLGAGKSNGAMNQKAKGNDDIFGAPGEYPINQRLIGKNP